MYSNNIDMRISPASLTKLMTGLILYESYELFDELTVSLPSSYIYEGKVAYLKNGNTLSTEQLLEFLLVYSANDAAHIAALQVSDTVEDFVLLMNKRAKQLGMNNTNFSNPEGLDDNDHYSTLNDLLTLGSTSCGQRATPWSPAPTTGGPTSRRAARPPRDRHRRASQFDRPQGGRRRTRRP